MCYRRRPAVARAHDGGLSGGDLLGEHPGAVRYQIDSVPDVLGEDFLGLDLPGGPCSVSPVPAHSRARRGAAAEPGPGGFAQGRRPPAPGRTATRCAQLVMCPVRPVRAVARGRRSAARTALSRSGRRVLRVPCPGCPVTALCPAGAGLRAGRLRPGSWGGSVAARRFSRPRRGTAAGQAGPTAAPVRSSCVPAGSSGSAPRCPRGCRPGSQRCPPYGNGCLPTRGH